MRDIFFALLVLCMGVIVAYTGIADSREKSRLEKSSAQVLSEPMTDYTEEQKNGKTIAYKISPSFIPEGSSSTYRCHATVKKEVIDRLQNDPVIAVRYVAEDPSICQVVGAESSSLWFMTLLGIILTLGSIAYIYNIYSVLRS